MSCTSCASDHQSKFTAEVNIHQFDLKNLNRQDVLIFADLVVCLDCGCSQLTVPKAKLALLATGTSKAKEASSDNPPLLLRRVANARNLSKRTY